ncbi:MAG TPA: PLP-dependent aminotransferase family protein [Gemmatimonadales bacterium]|nr:PLP-dependent aminotransferase family protein [Gemmatimonadales bacterium]
MPRRPIAPADLLIPLQPHDAEPMYRQIYRGLRDAILQRRLAPGARVPSTRTLSRDLGVSRNTVLLAFDQLLAEGYLVGSGGSGTYVAPELPDRFLTVGAKPRAGGGAAAPAGRLSRRGAGLVGFPTGAPRLNEPARAFRTGTPALDAFPIDLWARLAARRYRRLSIALLEHGDPAGYWPLREAIAEHVRAARGVQCEPAQVIVLGAAQQAIELAARALLDPGDAVWLEEPGYLGARGALLAAGARLVPVPVDREGIDVARGMALGPDARLVYVSPSHQYPTGATLSLSRRLALLRWAGEAGAWILEDDYDSEYRYAGRPLMALQGLDRDGRVLYVGTFSKTLFPSIRLAYLIAPKPLVPALVSIRGIGDQHASTIEQAVVADFMTEGHFARHVRRMRALYAERRAVFLDAAARWLDGLLEPLPADGGMHVLGLLREGVDDREASRAAAERGIEVSPLSLYYAGPCPRGGLLIGYAAVPSGLIPGAVRRLADALRAIPQQSGRRRR